MTKRRLVEVGVAAALVLAGLFWLGAGFRQTRGAYPTAADMTLAGYLQNRGTPQRAQRATNGESRVVVCIGGVPNGLMPSGPAVYIFDDGGKLIDYTIDSGDDPEFQRRWPDFWNGGDALSVEELRGIAEGK